jgi:hypothetical protein
MSTRQIDWTVYADRVAAIGEQLVEIARDLRAEAAAASTSTKEAAPK